MNICVVVPSSEYLGQAGVRIRYERISAHLLIHGVVLRFKVIDEFVENSYFNDDVYIISKVYDFRAVLLASEITASGKLVGPDLFDDYFSDTEDFRFTRLRNWLAELIKFSSFALCSTNKIKNDLKAYLEKVPSHVMNDPAEIEHEGIQKVLELIESKQSQLRDTQELRIVWFGIGDNPHFDVGIQDLVRFAPQALRKLKVAFPDIKLTLLTNKRALTTDAYELLKKLPVKYNVELWSEEKEQALLAGASVALLPVNYQSFSKVKSFNRAITALTNGAQVLSLGYDLYAPLKEIIYRRPEELIEDLESSSLRFSSDNISVINELFAKFASPVNEASKLVNFIATLNAPNEKSKNYVKLVSLGSNLDKKLYKFAAKHNWICVSPPALSKRANQILSIELCKDNSFYAFMGKGVQKTLIDIQNKSETQVISKPIQDSIKISGRVENLFSYSGNSFTDSILHQQSFTITKSVAHECFAEYVLINAETSKSFFAY